MPVDVLASKRIQWGISRMTGHLNVTYQQRILLFLAIEQKATLARLSERCHLSLELVQQAVLALSSLGQVVVKGAWVEAMR